MREIGRGMFMPLEALPDDAQRIISFSFFVVMALVAPLKKEGYEMKFVEVCMQTSNLFVLVHRPDEKFELYKQSADAFRYIVKNATPNVDEWREILGEIGVLLRHSVDYRRRQSEISEVSTILWFPVELPAKSVGRATEFIRCNCRKPPRRSDRFRLSGYRTNLPLFGASQVETDRLVTVSETFFGNVVDNKMREQCQQPQMFRAISTGRSKRGVP